ncbi:MAG: hypothetical protein ACRESS_02385 [Stenotrophobium sp.]
MRLEQVQNGKKALMIKLDFLVTGTGRCGTVYMSRLLTSLGIACGHEAIFTYKGLDAALDAMSTGKADTSFVSMHDVLRGETQPVWFDKNSVRAESSYMAAPFVDHPSLDDTAIIHLVRNPLAVISSFVTDIHFFGDGLGNFEVFREFVLTYMADVMHLATEIERACMYWIQWNEIIARKAKDTGKPYLVFKVESKLTDELLAFLKVPPSTRSAAFSNDKINSWKQRETDFTLTDIPDGDIKDRLVILSEKLGYVL